MAPDFSRLAAGPRVHDVSMRDEASGRRGDPSSIPSLQRLHPPCPPSNSPRSSPRSRLSSCSPASSRASSASACPPQRRAGLAAQGGGSRALRITPEGSKRLAPWLAPRIASGLQRLVARCDPGRMDHKIAALRVRERRIAALAPRAIAARPQCAGRAPPAAVAPVVPRACGRRGSRCGCARRSARPAPRRRAAPASAQVCALSSHISGVSSDMRRVHAEVERDLQRLERVVAAVGVAGEVGLAHAADEHVAGRGDRRRPRRR